MGRKNKEKRINKEKRAQCKLAKKCEKERLKEIVEPEITWENMGKHLVKEVTISASSAGETILSDKLQLCEKCKNEWVSSTNSWGEKVCNSCWIGSK